ncbi:glutathione S-transferase [Natronocella acetinitrilica]|uniref:Glutathione S-transferase n=1 Tax=Natronocella acetinitrilica TaxID=414046 RepID=A0AAE3G731_9GAMM|nr:glutathione S-transferase [Natronocella acetinitrilica]
MNNLVLWGRSTSSNVQKVLCMLAELELPFEQKIVGAEHGGLDTPQFLALNPWGRIPVLVDGDLVIRESTAILRYLAAQYGAERFWPDSPAERARVDMWLDWVISTLQPDFTRLFISYYRTPEARRKEQVVSTARAACEKHFSGLDRHLANSDFLAGDTLSLADFPIAPAVYRYFRLGLELPDLPHLRAYQDRLADRPAFRTHAMVPFEFMYGELSGG